MVSGKKGTEAGERMVVYIIGILLLVGIAVILILLAKKTPQFMEAALKAASNVFG